MKKTIKKLAILTFLSAISLQANELKFSGQTNYTQQQNKALITSFNVEYRVDLYEPDHKIWVVYLGGRVNPDYDHFGNEFKTNVFTTLGIDF